MNGKFISRKNWLDGGWVVSEWMVCRQRVWMGEKDGWEMNG